MQCFLNLLGVEKMIRIDFEDRYFANRFQQAEDEDEFWWI